MSSYVPASYLSIYLFLSITCYANTMTADASQPFFSVVMPTYNRADFYLPRAIESVLKQNFQDFELIIVDDASTDNTTEVVKSYIKNDNRIRYVRNETNKHISYSRNRGNNMAKGKYIAILDSDNFAHPDWLSEMHHFINQNQNKDIYIPKRDKYTEKKLNEQAANLTMFWHYPLYDMFFYSAIDNNGITFRRDFMTKHHVQSDENIMRGGDWDFWLQMGYAGAAMIRVPGKTSLVTIRMHTTNPKEYYNRGGKDKGRIREKLFTFLDVPKDKRNNKCAIIQTAREKMPNYIPEKEWNSGIKRYCLEK